MKTMIVLASLLFVTPALAKDVALILNDQEQNALRQVLDVATKANGLQIANTTLYFLNKLNAAGTVTEQKDQPDTADKPTPKPDKDTQP